MIVVDASVTFKWFREENEQGVKEAETLLQHHLDGKNSIIVPDLLVYELSNALATKTKVPLNKLRQYLKKFQSFSIKSEAYTFEFVTSAITFSKKYKVSVYDASYAVLAKEKKCDLITADEKFVKQVNLPFVKSLSDYIP